jgi:hypothetical protein
VIQRVTNPLGAQTKSLCSGKDEPAHIHVRTPEGECKFWIEPMIALAYNRGVRAHDLREVERHIYENHAVLIKAFHEYQRR